MADKGDVYYCTWRKTDSGEFVGWEKASPSRKARAGTMRELQRELGEIVGEYHNDHEAALHFDPQLSETREWDHLFADGLYQIGWNSSFTYRESAESAFVGGRCTQCGIGLGGRSDEPLRVGLIDSETDGAFSGIGPPPHGNAGVVEHCFRAIPNGTHRRRARHIRYPPHQADKELRPPIRRGHSENLCSQGRDPRDPLKRLAL